MHFLHHFTARDTPSWIAASLPTTLPSNSVTILCLHHQHYPPYKFTQYLPCTLFRFPVFPFCQFPFITLTSLFTPYAHVPNPVNHHITYVTKNGISTNRYYGHHDWYPRRTWNQWGIQHPEEASSDKLIVCFLQITSLLGTPEMCLQKPSVALLPSR